MEIQSIIMQSIRNFESGRATSIHIDDFKKFAIARELKRVGYQLDWWSFNSDTDHYKVEIGKIKGGTNV
jgi:hypothetical protein